MQVSTSQQEKANQELTELYGELHKLRNQIEDRYRTALEWKAKRDDLNKIKATLIAKLKEEREQRNGANGKVAELKTLKEGFKKELEETEKSIESLNANKRKLILSLREDPVRVRERIKELEWFLQTNVMSLTRENDLVKEISLLEKKLTETRSIDEVDAKLATATSRAQAIKNKLGELRTQMLEPVKVSQDHHNNVIDLVNQIDDVKKQADEAHRNYLEAFDSASLALASLRKAQDRIRELNGETGAEKKKKKEERVKEIEQKMEQIATHASEKVKKGGRLTIDELSVLVQKGFFNEAEKS
jgi:uncharacterized coiled-coil DUF342 family protein